MKQINLFNKKSICNPRRAGRVHPPDSSVVNTNTTMKNFKGSIQHLRVYNIAIMGDSNTEYIKNGGFEVTATGQTNWEMTRFK